MTNTDRNLYLKIKKLSDKIKRSPVYEDRLEYEEEDLARMYRLTSDEARLLREMLHEH